VKRIILFGSTARGDNGKDSDLDICVITDHTVTKRLDLTRELRRAIAPVVSVPTDIFVYNENEFNKRVSNPFTFEHSIQKEGVLLHEQ
jgi:predicted nucleotidyltransferase